MQYVDTPFPITIGELTLDEYPLFLFSDHVTVVNDRHNYVHEFIELCDSEGGENGQFLWKLAVTGIQHYKVLEAWNECGEGLHGSWQKFVNLADCLRPLVSSIDAMYGKLHDSEQIVQVMEYFKHCQHIANRVVDIPSLVNLDFITFFQTQKCNLVYIDCSRLWLDQSVVESIVGPVLLLAGKNRYNLPGWEVEDVGRYEVINNFEVLKNGITGSECE